MDCDSRRRPRGAGRPLMARLAAGGPSVGRPALLLQSTPAQRLLVQGVMAVSEQLVRSISLRAGAASIRELVEARHRMLRELGQSVRMTRPSAAWQP